MKKVFKFLLAILFMIFFQVSEAQTITKWKVDDLKTAIQKADKPTIFNFWATFCKPCIEEMPHFQELAKKYESYGVQLILVSLDLPEAYPVKIEKFAARQRLSGLIPYLDETDADIFCPIVDKSWSGAIPASLFINHKTGYRKFYEEQLSKEKLEKEIRAMMGEN